MTDPRFSHNIPLITSTNTLLINYETSIQLFLNAIVWNMCWSKVQTKRLMGWQSEYNIAYAFRVGCYLSIYLRFQEIKPTQVDTQEPVENDWCKTNKIASNIEQKQSNVFNHRYISLYFMSEKSRSYSLFNWHFEKV